MADEDKSQGGAKNGKREEKGGPVKCAPIADDLLALCNLRRMVRN